MDARIRNVHKTINLRHIVWPDLSTQEIRARKNISVLFVRTGDWKKRVRENSGKAWTICIDKGSGVRSKVLTMP
jgi:hypothetical protein